MSTSYEISESAAKDWQIIATYTMQIKGEEELRALFKDFEKSIKKMATGEDDDLVRYISLYHQTVPIIHCRDYFIFGVFREGSPLLVYAIYHKSADLVQRLSKQYNFYEKPYSHHDYLESLRNDNPTQADYDAMTQWGEEMWNKNNKCPPL